MRLFAWLLLLCMFPMSVTKITHRHGSEQTSCCKEHTDCQDEQEQHDPCSCQICKFTLSPFIALESTPLVRFSVLLPFEFEKEEKQLYIEPIHSYLLRGPPTV